MKLQRIIKKGKRILGTGLLVGALASNVYAADFPKAQFFGGIGFALKYNSSYAGKIRNVPLEIRDVLIHPDDEYKVPERNRGPIEKDSVDLSSMLSVGDIKSGIYIPFIGNFGLQSGLQLELMVPTDFPEEYNKRNSMRERNYLGSNAGTNERGVGTALTYYSAEEFYIQPKNKYFKPSFFIEMVKKGERDENDLKRNILLGYSFNQTGILLETGWDRYNQLERKDFYPVARVNEHRIYAGLYSFDNDNFCFGGSVGLSIRDELKPTNLGKSLDIDQNKIGWFGGVFIGFDSN